MLVELDPLNHLLERDEKYEKLAARRDPAASPLILESLRRWRSPETLLQPIGEALAILMAREDFAHVKACEGPTCTLLFADHTRGHTRRWCSMDICGNRAKQAAHRTRAKTHQPIDTRCYARISRLSLILSLKCTGEPVGIL